MSPPWLPVGYHLVGLDLTLKKPKYHLRVRTAAHDGAHLRLPRRDQLPLVCKVCAKRARFKLFVCCTPTHFGEWCALVRSEQTRPCAFLTWNVSDGHGARMTVLVLPHPPLPRPDHHGRLQQDHSENV